MKTDKYTNMIEAFECDLRLAKDGRNSLSNFDADLQKDDSKISKDLELLEELSFLLRNGKAEISLISDGFEGSENNSSAGELKGAFSRNRRRNKYLCGRIHVQYYTMY